MTIPLTAMRRQRTHPLYTHILLALVAQVAPVFAQTGPTQWTANPFNPPSYPLAVRSPYLNSWIPQGNGPAALNTVWPQHWPKVQGNVRPVLIVSSTCDLTLSSQNLGWYCAVQVDGTTYRLMGGPSTPAVNTSSQTSVEFTPTRTTYSQRAGPVDVNMTFWSPVEVRVYKINYIGAKFVLLYTDSAPLNSTAHNSLRMSFVSHSQASILVSASLLSTVRRTMSAFIRTSVEVSIHGRSMRCRC